MHQNSQDSTNSPRWQWWLAVASGVLTVIFGSIGIWKYNEQHAPDVSHGFDPVYHALQMLILHTPHFEAGMNRWIEAGRWFGALTLVITSLALLWRRFRHEFNLFRLARWSGHHIVCGLGHKGFKIVCRLKARGERVVVIDPEPDSHLAVEVDKLGIFIIRDDAAEIKVLARARVAQAREIIVITPTDEVNMRIAIQVREHLAGRKGNMVPCHVHLSDGYLREELQKRSEGHRIETGCELHFFDVFDNEARRVLLALPLDGAGISADDPRSVHVVILGFSRMGRSLALRAAKMGHFANGKLLRLSIVDRQANLLRDRFLFRYPGFKQNLVCDLNFHEMEAESITTRDLMGNWAKEKDTLMHVFICSDDDTRALEVAFRLQNILQKNPDCRLLARIHSQSSIAPLLGPTLAANKPTPKVGEQIIPFGMVDDACCEDVIRHEHNEALAQAIHEHFVNQRLADSSRRPENDPALQPWEKLREDLRESNRQQADHIAVKLRTIGCQLAAATDAGEAVTKFAPAEIELLARVEHRRWNVERWLADWHYGTPSDKSRRISENLVSWEELHESIRDYDRKAVESIPMVLAKAMPPMKVVRGQRASTA